MILKSAARGHLRNSSPGLWMSRWDRSREGEAQHNELILAFLLAQLIIPHQVSGIIQPRGWIWATRLSSFCVLKASGVLLPLLFASGGAAGVKNISGGYFRVGKEIFWACSAGAGSRSCRPQALFRHLWEYPVATGFHGIQFGVPRKAQPPPGKH